MPGTGAQRPTAANLEERFDYDAARNLAGASASAPDATVGSGLTNPTRFQSTPGGVTQIARGPRGEKIALDHDDCGRVIKRRVHRDGFRPQVWHYTWDVHDRLVGCTDPDGVRWVYAYDPFGRRFSKQRRFSEQELIYVRARWPELVADQPDLPERGSHYLRETAPGGHQPGDKTPPVAGTFYMWDGDQMVQEAPLRLDGTIDETSAIRWHYEDGDHTPFAKQLPGGELHYIVTDHLGTPKEMFDEAGELVWSATHYVWGAVRAVKMYGGGAGAATAWSDGGAEYESLCPFRFPGQYEDKETGLNYNRHRYYDALTGQYCSPDPIGLAGGDRPQGYVDRPGSWVDPLGLSAKLLPGEGDVGTYKELIRKGSPGDNITPHHAPANEFMQRHGVKKNDSIAINMEQPTPGAGGRHRRTRTYGKKIEGETPRESLARDVQDMRKIYQQDGAYGPKIRNNLQNLIKAQKTTYPDLFGP